MLRSVMTKPRDSEVMLENRLPLEVKIIGVDLCFENTVKACGMMLEKRLPLEVETTEVEGLVMLCCMGLEMIIRKNVFDTDKRRSLE